MNTAAHAKPITVAQARNDKRLEQFIKEVKSYGQIKAKGDLSIMSLAEGSVRSAKDGIIGAGDAKLVWETFQKARSSLSADMFQESKSFPQQVSKLKKIIEMGELGQERADGKHLDVEDIFSRAAAAYKDIHSDTERRKSLVGNIYENIVAVCRTQIQAEYAVKELTDDAMGEIMLPYKPEVIKTESDYLEHIIGALDKLAKGSKTRAPMPSEEARMAAQYLRHRVTNLEKAAAERDDGPDVATQVGGHGALHDEAHSLPVEDHDEPAPVAHVSKRQAKREAAAAAKSAKPAKPVKAVKAEYVADMQDHAQDHTQEDAIDEDAIDIGTEEPDDFAGEGEFEEKEFAGFKASADREVDPR